MSHHELGTLVNEFWPPVLGLLAIIVFLITAWISKKSSVRLVVVLICCLYLIYVGVALHFEKDYWPLIVW